MKKQRVRHSILTTRIADMEEPFGFAEKFVIFHFQFMNSSLKVFPRRFGTVEHYIKPRPKVPREIYRTYL